MQLQVSIRPLQLVILFLVHRPHVEMHGKFPHQIFEKDRFQIYILGHKKDAKSDRLRVIICILLVKICKNSTL